MTSSHTLLPAFAIIILLVSLAPPTVSGQETQILSQAHAHNDYLHSRPLLDALDQGFGSVEADVFLVGNELQVAHERTSLSPERTLRALYLEPLKQRVREHSGSVYGDGQNFTLLIDFKTSGEPTYEALHSLLSEYREIFSHFEQEAWKPGAVTAIVSGNRPIETISQAKLRFVGFDGRFTDLESTLPTHLMPLISDNWALHFQWLGEGKIPPADRQNLQELVAKAHSQQRRIRLWGTADTPAMWSELRDAGVDLINTDNLVGLSDFLKSINPQP